MGWREGVLSGWNWGGRWEAAKLMGWGGCTAHKHKMHLHLDMGHNMCTHEWQCVCGGGCSHSEPLAAAQWWWGVVGDAPCISKLSRAPCSQEQSLPCCHAHDPVVLFSSSQKASLGMGGGGVLRGVCVCVCVHVQCYEWCVSAREPTSGAGMEQTCQLLTMTLLTCSLVAVQSCMCYRRYSS